MVFAVYECSRVNISSDDCTLRLKSRAYMDSFLGFVVRLPLLVFLSRGLSQLFSVLVYAGLEVIA